jgi:hypothetical protein
MLLNVQGGSHSRFLNVGKYNPSIIISFRTGQIRIQPVGQLTSCFKCVMTKISIISLKAGYFVNHKDPVAQLHLIMCE